MKVIFANQFHDLAEKLGEEWGDVKEIITTDQEQMIGPSHLNSPKRKEIEGLVENVCQRMLWL